ncbi:MAG TPA: hypothetical protein PLP27_07080 [Crocinitomicaceae bacterium]|nr:hypothetical protein [Crocinitomicaceae bacterium]
MKLTKTLILTLLIYEILSFQYSYGQELNKQIDKSQKIAISKSPFKDAKGMHRNLTQQKQLRSEYLTIIDSLRTKFQNDTILLIENYNYICLGCPANYVQIQIGDNLISLRSDFPSIKYKTTKINKLSKSYSDTIGSYHSDINELINEASISDNWNINPAKYGIDGCLDGEHTFYSFIYPSGKIISMYMRCWIDIESRKITK